LLWSLFPDQINLRHQMDTAVVLLLFRALFIPGGLNYAWMRGLALFFVVHLGLHLLFLRHPQNEFKSVLSWILITGAALAGAYHFVVS
jgi:hypothetical protein